jgi:serine/threonine protein kinase
MEGKQIAGYVIESTLGEGGMGVVYRARDAKVDRELIALLPEEVLNGSRITSGGPAVQR